MHLRILGFFALYPLLCLQTMAAAVPVSVNLSHDGSYRSLLLKPPQTQFKPSNSKATVDSVHLTKAPNQQYEVWIEGEIEFELKQDEREDLRFDMYTRAGEYLRSAILPGKTIVVEILLQNQSGVVLLGGWQAVHVARDFRQKGHWYRSRFQFVHLFDQNLIEKDRPVQAKVQIVTANRG